MGFRWNFLIRFSTELAWLATSLIWYHVVYSYVSDLAGWTRYQYLFLVGISYAIQQTFESLLFVNCQRISELIRTGDLDFYLAKPVNSQFLVSTRYIDFGGFANIFLGIGLAGFAWHKLGLPIHSGHVGMFLVLFVNGVIIYYVLMFSFMCVSFWIVRNEYAIGFFFQITDLARQPAEIYNYGVKLFLTFFFPMVVCINFPANVMVRSLSMAEFAYGIALGVFFLFLSTVIWRTGLKAYSSASS
jgi:ABC-2 type transport system permease protein